MGSLLADALWESSGALQTIRFTAEQAARQIDLKSNLLSSTLLETWWLLKAASKQEIAVTSHLRDKAGKDNKENSKYRALTTERTIRYAQIS